jgi:predicted RNA-binding protein with PUA-like domain
VEKLGRQRQIVAAANYMLAEPAEWQAPLGFSKPSCYIFLIIVTQSASDGIMAYWLFKTEPDTFSIDTLRTQKVSCWEGVRNYQARNMMRDQVKVGDLVLIYHSSCKNVGVAGIAKVVREAYPDHFQFDPESDYYDPKSDPDNPRWIMVDVEFVRKTTRVIPLSVMKAMPELENMPLVKRGNRLSIMPVTEEEWEAILGKEKLPSQR